MSAVLTIDSGNTAVKMAVVDDGRVTDTSRAPELQLEEAARLIEGHSVPGIVYCSVRGVDARFVESLSRLTDARVLIVTSRTRFPIGIDYRTPSTLGLDRVTACVAVSELYPGEAALVVDAGTAVTADVLDASGTFRGGNISPGLGLRFRALHRFTERLPEVGAEGDTPEFGYDTETAIRSGAIRGLTAELESELREAGRLYGVRRLVMTGGDGELLSRRLAAGTDFEISYQPDLMALGLARIYHYNEKKSN